MSATAIWTVHCYGPPIEERSPACMWWIAEADTKAEAQKLARQQGWIVKPGINICPACQEVRPHD